MKFNIEYKHNGNVFNFKYVELLYFLGYIDIVGLNKDNNKLYLVSISMYPPAPSTYKYKRRLPLKRISTKKNIRYFLSKAKTESVIPVERGNIDTMFNKPYATELKKVIDILDKDLGES
jgi:hypothetical protein